MGQLINLWVGAAAESVTLVTFSKLSGKLAPPPTFVSQRRMDQAVGSLFHTEASILEPTPTVIQHEEGD